MAQEEEKKEEKKQDLTGQLEERRKTLQTSLEEEIRKFNDLTESRNKSAQLVNDLNSRLLEIQDILKQPKTP